jgi:hypothetical protein
MRAKPPYTRDAALALEGWIYGLFCNSGRHICSTRNFSSAQPAYSFKTILTSILTTGDTRVIVGKATTKAKAQALSQMDRILLTIPTLNTLITKDMMQDISNAMKNAKTKF